jgi:ABC-type sugar transport system ATPase subunit
VFQDLALSPHMIVFENIAFGLRVKHVPPDEVRRRVVNAAETMLIMQLLDKKPAQCSGGEAQRVALARTIVTNPSVFLMDEPLSSLDAKLRVAMRTECSMGIRAIGCPEGRCLLQPPQHPQGQVAISGYQRKAGHPYATTVSGY